MRRFFRSPVFPPQPNLGHVITKTEGPYDMGDVDPETGETISRMVDFRLLGETGSHAPDVWDC